MPMVVMRSGLNSSSDTPLNSRLPSSERQKPVTQLKNVVFPAPLGPMMLWIAFSPTSRSSWLIATSPPKRLVSPRDTRMAILDVPFLCFDHLALGDAGHFLVQLPAAGRGRAEAPPAPDTHPPCAP